jgi:hypothetical protein
MDMVMTLDDPSRLSFARVTLGVEYSWRAQSGVPNLILLPN